MAKKKIKRLPTQLLETKRKVLYLNQLKVESETAYQKLKRIPVETLDVKYKEKYLKKLDGEAKVIYLANLYEELRILQNVPRSDWHGAFEAALRLEIFEYGDKVSLISEYRLTSQPIRTDFMIIALEAALKFRQTIFRIFRKYNILDYKRPGHYLTEKTLRTSIAYGNYFISTDNRMKNTPSTEVTLTIYRDRKDEDFFRKAEKEGWITPDPEINGVYHVLGMTDIPFQILIGIELQGEEYAAFRALTLNANESDVKQLVISSKNETDPDRQGYINMIIEQVLKKNPSMAPIIGGDSEMESVLLDIVRPAVNKMLDDNTQQVTEQVTQQVTEQVTQQVTQQVTEQVTQQVTEQVTQQVTEQVTQQVTQQVTEQLLSGIYNQLRGNKEALSSLQNYVQSLNLPEDQQAKYIAQFESDDSSLDKGET